MTPITENPLFQPAAPWRSRPLPVAGALHPLRWLIAGVWIQAIRRNEIFVVGILLALYLIGALVLRLVGIQSEQTARFVAGLGLELGSILSTALVIVMGARQLPVEIEQRTIYPVLAKPVTRNQLLAGKALPTWFLGVAAMGMFTAVTLAVTPRLGYQQWPVLAQALALKTLALAMLTAMVFWIALWLPAAVAMLLTGCVAFLGTLAGNLLTGGAAWPWLTAGLAGLIPDFKLLDQFSRYIDGGAALPPAAMLGLLAYGGLWLAIFGGLAAARFRRLPL